MSFAKEVKEEIVAHTFSPEQALMFISGFIKHNGELIYTNNGFQLVLTSTSNAIIRNIFMLLKSVYNGKIEISILQTQMITRKKIFQLTLVDNIKEFLIKNSLYDFENSDKIIEVIINNEDINKSLIRAYISGVFVASGSVNSPETSNYHLEFQFKDLHSAEYICRILNDFEFNFKVIAKKSKYVCYVKKSTHVSDFLKFVDAGKSAMKFENIRISRDLANSINRVGNIDIYNQQKTSSTGLKQVQQITLIKNKHLLGELSVKAQVLANLRLQNPTASYSDLEVKMNEEGVNITKSGVSNLFKIITKIAESIGE
ncbi:hypothetical protein SCLARK_001863 [Spiroplasma clarkii]|uniref:Probable cell division protein WhiA n=1 Tax=Spiroplasma clarkii TaxID=2139 RepID=A0A1Y0L2S9_9MOLU|nr:DNA-binding protein WhiA [Spiroplasma clarkii]ARU92297.1 hypothetical protein SCLARK_001863 [Spiroplasma clarkii]ATX71607.1 hypothetical protein SCLAR_v1c13090 [Spiroplasma clarkii]